MPIPAVSQSPVGQEFVQNPYPFYDRVRSMGDFVFWTEFEMPMATTHEAVSAVLRHRKLGRQCPADQKNPVPKGLEPFYDLEQNSLLELDGPAHTRLRGLLARSFIRAQISSLAPEISMVADRLIDGFPTGPFDLIDLYARHLPVIIIARLLGVPEDRSDQLLEWSNAMVSMYPARRNKDIETAAATASTEFSEYLRTVIEERRSNPKDDLLTQLIRAEESGDKMNMDELVSTCVLLLNAGHEATVHSIGNAVRNLIDFDNRALALQPEHIENTVEECLRYSPPLHMFTRCVYEDVSILDEDFKAGDQIGCLLGSSCRDDAVWPDSNVFDPFRASRLNTAFGAGVHFCLGAPLARLEMQIALPILFARCPNLKLVEPPRVADLYHFHGLQKLMVSL